LIMVHKIIYRLLWMLDLIHWVMANEYLIECHWKDWTRNTHCLKIKNINDCLNKRFWVHNGPTFISFTSSYSSLQHVQAISVSLKRLLSLKRKLLSLDVPGMCLKIARDHFPMLRTKFEKWSFRYGQKWPCSLKINFRLFSFRFNFRFRGLHTDCCLFCTRINQCVPRLLHNPKNEQAYDTNKDNCCWNQACKKSIRLFWRVCGLGTQSVRSSSVSDIVIIVVKTKAAEASVTILNVVASSLTPIKSIAFILKTKAVIAVTIIPTVPEIAIWRHQSGDIGFSSLRNRCSTWRRVTIPTGAAVPWRAGDECTSGHAIAHREAWPTAAPMVICAILIPANGRTSVTLRLLSSTCTLWPFGVCKWK